MGKELDIEKTISALEAQIEFLDYTGSGFAYSAVVMREALDLLKKQKEIIDKYRTADTFLDAHGWKWE